MNQGGATLKVPVVIQHGAILEVLLCQEALVVAKAIVPGAGAYLQRENLHTVLHQSLVQDLHLAASWGLHVRYLMACGTLAPATFLVVEMDELRFKSWITCELSAIGTSHDNSAVDYSMLHRQYYNSRTGFWAGYYSPSNLDFTISVKIQISGCFSSSPQMSQSQSQQEHQKLITAPLRVISERSQSMDSRDNY